MVGCVGAQLPRSYSSSTLPCHPVRWFFIRADDVAPCLFVPLLCGFRLGMRKSISYYGKMVVGRW